MISEVTVQGDHFQILVGDSKLALEADTTHLWNDRRSAVVSMPGIIGISVARFGGAFEVTVALYEEFDPSGWESMGVARLLVPSGFLVLFSPESDDADAQKVRLSPGSYHVAIYSRNTRLVSDEMQQSGSDRYAVVLRRVETGTG